MPYHNLQSKLESDRKVTVFGPCQVTGKQYEVKGVCIDALDKWLNGMLIQDAFPDMSSDDREFLISGTSPEGWKQIFLKDEE